MTDDLSTAGPLGEAGARLRALVATWRADTAQDAGSFVIDPWNRDAGIRLCADALEAELDALLSAPVVIGGDGPPIASCLLCGLNGPLAVWYSGTRAGVCDTCRAKVSAPVVSVWQPIATVPKDRWVWLGRPPVDGNPKALVISAFKWDESHDGWFAGMGWWPQIPGRFTHWAEMSQPQAAPVVTQEGE